MARLLPFAAAAVLLSPGCGTGSARGSAQARLRHPDPSERMAALADLERQPGPPDGQSLLHAALLDPDPPVRRSAALLLESRTGGLLEQAALEALEGDRPDAEVAEALLGDRREALRAAAVGALRRLGTPRAWALLADRMSSEPSAGVRALCAQAAAEGASRGAGAFHGRLLEALKRGLSDGSPEVRIPCARALATAGDRSGAALLAGALAGADASSRGEWVSLLRTATGEDLGEEAGPWMERYGVGAGAPR